MILEFGRSGGITGMSVLTTIDTDDLPQSQATRLQELIARIVPERVAGNVPDGFMYTLKITKKVADGERSNTFRFGHGRYPELTEMLTDIARGAKAPA